MRLLLLITACFLACTEVLAAEPVDYYARIKANYAKLTPFSATVTCTIVDAGPEPPVTFVRLIACDTDKYRCLFLAGDRAPQEHFRTGKVWYRCDPQIPSYYKGFVDSVGGCPWCDPHELGSHELSVSLASALTDPKAELLRRDKNEIVLQLVEPTKVAGLAWRMHLSENCGLPIKSQFFYEDKMYMEMVLSYREVAQGVFFPREMQHTFYDRTTGAWTQRVTYSYELTASRDRDVGEKLVPPAVPEGASVIDYTIKKE